MKYLLSILLVGLFIVSCSVKPKVPVSLSKLFSNQMVIQRDVEIHVFGVATPGIKINAKIAGNQSNAKVDKDGGFNISLPKLKAGGPYELV
ncbi:MAG: hypothetical protein KAH25_01750, partial [Bacteroidales bacterium]|nr:hypothetical protein [Bacteroidales bacterium]